MDSVIGKVFQMLFNCIIGIFKMFTAKSHEIILLFFLLIVTFAGFATDENIIGLIGLVGLLTQLSIKGREKR